MMPREDLDKQNAWLLDLYEGSDGSDRAAPNDPEDADTLRSMKALLDDRAPHRPDPKSISAVLAAARGEVVPSRVHQDRRPVRRERPVALRVGAVSAAAVALIALFAIWQPSMFRGDDPAPALRENASEALTAESEPAPSEELSMDPAPQDEPSLRQGEVEAPGLATDLPDVERPVERLIERPAISPAQAIADRDRPPVTDEVPADLFDWDPQDDVIDVHQRIETIGMGVEHGWEAPAVPLEIMPSSRGNGNIVPAGQRR